MMMMRKENEQKMVSKIDSRVRVVGVEKKIMTSNFFFRTWKFLPSHWECIRCWNTLSLVNNNVDKFSMWEISPWDIINWHIINLCHDLGCVINLIMSLMLNSRDFSDVDLNTTKLGLSRNFSSWVEFQY